jgi:hypothetical protein
MTSRLSVFLIVFLCCCAKKDLTEPVVLAADQHWNFYEGKIPLDDTRSLIVELALLTGDNPLEGSYRLTEKIESENILEDVSDLEGSFSMYNNNGRVILQLLNSSLSVPVKRTFYRKNEKGKSIFQEENLRARDLSLLYLDDDMMSVLATFSEPVSTDPSYYVYKKSSDPFTIEGYFRHTGDSADFYEMNTERRWAISKSGAYASAIKQYHLLAEEKFEPVYLKGVGFSINRPDKTGKKVQALVIKRLLQMSSAHNSDE